MPDEKREEFVTAIFLQHYNSITDKQYENLGRPEDVGVSGTYEFLCKDKNSKSDYLAIEEKSLNTSTENVRDNVEIGKIVTEVHRILNKKGLSYNKGYYFGLEFRKAPQAKQRTAYARNIAKSAEEVIKKNINADTRDRGALDVEDCDLVKKLYLSGTDSDEGVYFLFDPESNFSVDVGTDAFNAVRPIIQKTNAKLRTPRQEEKKTILLISNMVSNFHVRHIKEAIKLLDEKKHSNIDEIYFINQRNHKPVTIDRIK
jgi:hypothetical protein